MFCITVYLNGIINCLSLMWKALRKWTILGSLHKFIDFQYGYSTQNFSGMKAQRKSTGVSLFPEEERK